MRSADDAPIPLPSDTEQNAGNRDPARAPLVPDVSPLGEGPGGQEAVTTLPPAPPVPQWAKPDPGATARTCAVLDRFLLGLVVLFAAIIASVPARNSDLWLHLASGRLIAQGAYPFGVDPFTYAAPGLYWANHSWLYDLLSYVVFQSLGGWALVAVKVGLLGTLAVFLILLGRPPRLWRQVSNLPMEGKLETCRHGVAATAGLGVSALCAALAFLAMAPWSLLQPVCVSYLCLGLTLWLLVRTDRRLAQGPRSPGAVLAACWPLLVLFVLWVNLDTWFLLGPLAVGLFGLGAVLDGWKDSSRWAAVPAWGLVLVAGLAVCLLNPHHYHAFTLPAQLGFGSSGEALRHNPVFAGVFLSPFDPVFYRTGLGPLLAWGLLTFLGLVSFLAHFPVRGSFAAVPAWRVLIWLALLVFSAWRAWAIPFFAIAAAPILSLNLQDLALRGRERPELQALRRPILGRFAALLAALLLVAAAWPGWVQGRVYGPPRWGVLADPSLQKAAEQLAQWRENRLSSLEHGLNFSTAAANYCAWFAPEEQGFFDSRLHGNAADWHKLRSALLTEGDGPAADRAAVVWRDLFRKHQIDHVILDDAPQPRLGAVLGRMASNPGEWDLLYLGGHTVVFGWRGPPDGPRKDFAVGHVDLNRRGLLPATGNAGDQAPLAGPDRWPEPPAWWGAFSRVAPPFAFDRDEASVCLLLFDLLRPPRMRRNVEDARKFWQNCHAAGLAAAPFLGGGTSLAVACGTRLHLLQTPPEFPASGVDRLPFRPLVGQCFGWYLARQDDGPPGLLLLAIRAARRAIQANPEDAQAYLTLAEAYLRLNRFTGERAWCSGPAIAGEPFPLLDRVRRVQILTALNQALVVQPDLLEAHRHLALLYTEGGCQDLTLKHMKAYLSARRAAGPAPGETPEQFAEHLAQLQKEVEAKNARVSELLDRYEVNAVNLPTPNQARQAAEKGLIGKALEVLLESDVADFGAEGMETELNLLLSTGRPREVQEWMEPGHKDLLGRDVYFRTLGIAAAAKGDYREADRNLGELTHPGAPAGSSPASMGPEAMASLTIANLVLAGRQRHQTIASAVFGRLQDEAAEKRLQEMATRLWREAETSVLRGLLAWEQGDVAHAVQCFQEAFDRGRTLSFPGRELAERSLRLLGKPPRTSP
jgi:tetratricopeptide (TPR) repeat protein